MIQIHPIAFPRAAVNRRASFEKTILYDILHYVPGAKLERMIADAACALAPEDLE